MLSYLLRLVPYYLGWVISRVFLGWIALVGLCMGMVLLLGYVIEFLTFSTLILSGGGANSFLQMLEIFVSKLPFTDMVGFFQIMTSPIMGVLGFLFTFLLLQVSKVLESKIYLIGVLVILVVGTLCMMPFTGILGNTPFVYEFLNRAVGASVCVLGFYMVDIGAQTLRWILFMLHVMFLNPGFEEGE